MKQKYLLVSFLILSSFWLKAQSITIDPSQADENTIIKKDGIGLSHQSVDGAIKIGTKVTADDAMIQTHTDNNLSFGTFNSTPQMTLTKAGNLGIGTKTPVDRLDLSSNTGLRASIVTLSDDFAGLRFKNNLGHYFMGVNASSNRFVVVDNTVNKERFTINSQGFVGINENNPTSFLHVNGGTILSESDELEEQVLIGTNVINNEAKVVIQNANYPHALKINGRRSSSGTAVVVEGNTEIDGNLTITGSLAKGSGTFKIDHPLDPENKYLYHSFVESPDMMNVYNGNTITDAGGNATITLPDYFEALNMDYRYQLTPIGQFAQAIIMEKVTGNQFKIKTDKPTVEVSWQVTGIRNDAFAKHNRVKVTVDKPNNEKGTYMHAAAFESNKINTLNKANHAKK